PLASAEAGRGQDLGLVERLPLEEGGRQAVELGAVLAQQLEGEPVALVDELADLAVDELGGGLAVAGEAAACLVGAGEVGVLSGGEGEGADAFVHAPAGDHLGGEARDLLEV